VSDTFGTTSDIPVKLLNLSHKFYKKMRSGDLPEAKRIYLEIKNYES